MEAHLFLSPYQQARSSQAIVVDPGLQRLHALLEVAAETFTVVRVSECARGGWSIIFKQKEEATL